MFRFITFALVWLVGVVGGMLIGISENDWAERFTARRGGDPDAGGRVLRFAVMSFGVFVLPMLHIVIWEIVAQGGS
jgi:hypothetical protein